MTGANSRPVEGWLIFNLFDFYLPYNQYPWSPFLSSQSGTATLIYYRALSAQKNKFSSLQKCNEKKIPFIQFGSVLLHGFTIEERDPQHSSYLQTRVNLDGTHEAGLHHGSPAFVQAFSLYAYSAFCWNQDFPGCGRTLMSGAQVSEPFLIYSCTPGSL